MNPQSEEPRPGTGTVFLVGIGPGDAGLLTLRGAEVLAEADVVITAREPGPEMAKHRAPLLAHCRDGVQVIDPEQVAEEIDTTAVRHAEQGRRVVRLYSGDPFLGCRGDRLADACRAAGVDFEVVPGVSSVSGVPAFAGVPMMPPGVSELRVVNAREDKVDWPRLAADLAGRDDASLAVFFPEVPDDGGRSGTGFDWLVKTLTAGGHPGTTPVAVTRMGGTTEQSTIRSTLSRLTAEMKAADAKGHNVTSPALFMMGPGVARQADLSWYESKPLFGWRVLVPRTKEQAASLSEQLRSYGAVPEEVPTISVEPPRTPQQMERAVRGLVTGRYQWVAFTSVNAVRAIRERFEEYGLDARAFAGVKVAAVGEQTAARLREFGIQPDLMPPEDRQSGAGLVEVWPPYDAELDPIERVLLPRADIATETLSAGLTDLGWEVDDVTAYRTVRAAPPPAPVREAIKGGAFDAVLFTSSSTVRNLVGIAGKPHNTTVIAVIGPETEKTALEFGLRVDVVAPKASVSALAEAVSEYGAKQRAEALAAGKPALKPSQKRRGRRRKAL
ncbi:uroporphyrinogen-III synthase [Nocardiopsis composta]|uniref:Uroporphyrinogen III methyltransferase/synthase n=1 Tax=Nocardiopsis composta TaxID=157465 RepID=A0A7W8QPH9_9ACTN|nr:uroporphyrinogen-III synthase [Nocardiopsis composta]MBB5434074.1 uroporphyrinogen III methyltransferase/synthase [Nocardiopsis composta]